MVTTIHFLCSGARRAAHGAGVLLAGLLVALLILPGPAAASTVRLPARAQTGQSRLAIPVLGKAVQNYPRLANLYAYKDPGQVGTFARYGLVVAPLSAAADGAVAALKARRSAARVLAYLDARSVPLPDFGGDRIYSGWWLTLAGTTLAAPVDARATTIRVSDARRIAARLASNPDVLVGGETMHVVAADGAGGTLTVRRGYLSAAAMHPAGARVAAHATSWPGTWMLNVTRYCPTDPATGQTWASYLERRAATVRAAAPWDGIFYDDADRGVTSLSDGQVDADNNNVADGGDGSAGMGWADGMATLFRRTRALIPGATLAGNAGYYPGASDGREFEHFPYYDGDWSAGFAGYLQAAGSNQAGASIVNPDTGGTGVQDLRAMRFGLGSALMGDGYYTYDYGATSHGQTWWYDEYDAGAGSSLAAGVDAGATTLRVAAGTGRRFRPGDVVWAPSSVYTNAGLTLDDERMRVTRVDGDVLRVRRGAWGSLAAAHRAGTKVLTAAQDAVGQGWLGRPVGPARARALTTPNLLADGDFEGANGLAGWSLCTCGNAAAAAASRDTSTAARGRASARIDVRRATPSAPWNVEFSHPGLRVTAGTAYTLSFWARAAAGRSIDVAVQQAGAPWTARADQSYTIDTTWRRYTLTFTPALTEGGLKVQFNLAAAAGAVWLDGVAFQQGDPNVWQRDFTHGTVLLNATGASRTIVVGPGYRRIRGTQDPATNSGAVATRVALAPHDAILLVKTS